MYNPLIFNLQSMKYKSKNIVNIVWFLPFVFLMLNLLVLGIEILDYPEVMIPSVIGGGGTAYYLWLKNKDLGIMIKDDKMVITNSDSEFVEFKPDEILDYKVIKSHGLTSIQISGKDLTVYNFDAFLYRLDGIEEAMDEFLKSA
jgi:hypothetical protein